MAFYAKFFSNLCSRTTLFDTRNALMSWIRCPHTFTDPKAGVFSRQMLVPVNPELHSLRTKVRQHFPRPSERKRIARHGYEARLKTPGGRAVLMRRILKGRFVLSH